MGDFVQGDFRISLHAGRNDYIDKEKMIPEKGYIMAAAKSLSRQEWLRSSVVGLQKKQDCSSIVTKGKAACTDPVDL